uniref:Uncharacterized protein n=1 Tax=Rhizophora mucronata TaxID=61149 RepID=A0A2P2N859_RHIMU
MNARSGSSTIGESVPS